ncbi:Hypothetical_protein [Hexamita inflata]|uniref:Hypothetical_protein n=1 Tax=Hexamita inflata TaxID=28002 RepID=A0AA86R005_9EUKA|nr:Hypothetical protein HINF_LOCUS51457 [Hexamita inflata]
MCARAMLNVFKTYFLLVFLTIKIQYFTPQSTESSNTIQKVDIIVLFYVSVLQLDLKCLAFPSLAFPCSFNVLIPNRSQAYTSRSSIDRTISSQSPNQGEVAVRLYLSRTKRTDPGRKFILLLRMIFIRSVRYVIMGKQKISVSLKLRIRSQNSCKEVLYIKINDESQNL